MNIPKNRGEKVDVTSTHTPSTPSAFSTSLAICAKSGIKLAISFGGVSLPYTAGITHPVFYASATQRAHLYQKYTRGDLSPTDSYLLLLAILDSSKHIDFREPVTLDPACFETAYLIAENIKPLLAIVEASALVVHPHFEQPRFVVTSNSCDLSSLPAWIEAWEDNLDSFGADRRGIIAYEEFQKLENRLTALEASSTSKDKYTYLIASWADNLAEFPPELATTYRKCITECFSIDKMFATPLQLLKEVKEYCEVNIPATAIHFGVLIATLEAGIARHLDYLGGSSLALGYSILPSLVDTDKLGAGTTGKVHSAQKGEDRLESLIGSVDLQAGPPTALTHPNPTELLKAKLAYRTAKRAKS